jgi:hypothetical protein
LGRGELACRACCACACCARLSIGDEGCVSRGGGGDGGDGAAATLSRRLPSRAAFGTAESAGENSADGDGDGDVIGRGGSGTGRCCARGNPRVTKQSQECVRGYRYRTSQYPRRWILEDTVEEPRRKSSELESHALLALVPGRRSSDRALSHHGHRQHGLFPAVHHRLALPSSFSVAPFLALCCPRNHAWLSCPRPPPRGACRVQGCLAARPPRRSARQDGKVSL